MKKSIAPLAVIAVMPASLNRNYADMVCQRFISC